MAEPDIIVSYIRRKGWQTQHSADGWRITRGDEALYLSFTPSWVCLQAPLSGYLPERALNADERTGLYRYLLACNEHMFMAKFCRDQAGVLTLQAELPLSGGIHRIDEALDAVTRYLAQHEPALRDPARLDAQHAETGEAESKERYFESPPGIPHEVIAYFVRAVEARGWGLRDKPKGIMWPLGYKGQRLFDVYLTVTRAWAYFHIPVLDHAPVAGSVAGQTAQEAYLAYLLSANDAWFMAKLGLDAQDRTLVMLDVPTPELDFDTFRMVTQLLATYLDLYAREIQIMAHLPADPRLAERLVYR